MLEIERAIEITDRMTVPLMNMANSFRLVASAFQNMQNISTNAPATNPPQNSIVDSLKDKVGGVIGDYFSVEGLSMVMGMSDELVQTTARLNMMNDGLQTTEDLQNMIFLSAESSRTSYASTADAIAQLGGKAGNAFGSNAETIQFAENLNKQFIIAGATQEEISSAIQQLSQSLGSGVLHGEELNAVFDAAPNIIQTIADYMGKPIRAIEEMASNGLITADIVKNAMLGATDSINQKFESMPMTFAQSLTSLANNMQKSFQPVFERLNQLVNSDEFKMFINILIESLVFLSGIVMEVMDIACKAARFIMDNWSLISPIVYGVAFAVGLYTAALLINKGVQAASAIATGISSAATAMHTAFTNKWTLSIFAQTVAQQGLNAALLACPITWIIILIIAVIVVIYLVIAAINEWANTTISATGVICGAIAWMCALIWNIVASLLNALIQSTWTTFMEPFIGIWEWILNAMNGGFNSFGGAVSNLLGQIISWFLSLGKVVTKIIDTIFGANWTAGLNSLQDKVLSWGKNENAITISRDAPTIGRLKYGDSWDAGYKFGKGIDKSIANFDPSKPFENTIPKQSDYTRVQSSLDNIDKNTMNTGEKTEEAREYLKYIRDIAEREIINRYTTAEIKVKMTNNNRVSSNMDLDGVSRYLRNQVENEMYVAAEGVH